MARRRPSPTCAALRPAVAILTLVLMGTPPAAADTDDAGESPPDLLELGIEELLDLEVTSVSKKREKVSEAAAAVHVLTAEDLRRSGHTTIPEALRMVPGLHVAQIDANHWAVTSRGFNGRFANKLLVMMDGRTLYTPLFSGVFWKVQDTLLEDVERIEVVRGPGGSLWGANAVNGIINIITKQASDTQGVYMSSGVGSHERASGSARFGGPAGDTAHYRVYAKYDNRDDFVNGSNDRAHDAWDVLRGGFRMDWDASDADRVTFQGDVYDGEADQTVVEATLAAPFSQTFQDQDDTSGANLLARWSHVFSETSNLTLGLYWDRTTREDRFVREDRNTLDLDFQHRFSPLARHDVVWGFGYRFTADEIQNSSVLTFPDRERSDHLLSAFVHDEISLLEDQLRLTLGSKFERNQYSGYEVQPSARLAWVPNEKHSVWTAASRAVRTPSRFEDDFQFDLQALQNPAGGGFPPLLTRVTGTDDLDSEELIALEAGYRFRPMDHVSLDLAVFYNEYDQLRTLEPGAPSLQFAPMPHFLVPALFANRMEGRSRGVELAAEWRALPWWRLAAAYTYFDVDLEIDEASLDVTSEAAEGDDPSHRFHVRSQIDLPGNLEFDTALYFAENLASQDVPGYVRVDFRLGWRPTEAVELSLNLQNAFEHRHKEFDRNFFLVSSEVPRSAYAKLSWRF